jgi:hypothetical protein
MSHEDELNLIDEKYRDFLRKTHSTPLTSEICDLISLVEQYKLQADILLIKASKLEKMVKI